jgi:AraC-like DNA-binding protein
MPSKPYLMCGCCFRAMLCRFAVLVGAGKQNGCGMSRRLTEITDWPARAAVAQWCVNTLAEACVVSLPQLERHFHETWGQSPRAWLQAERMRRACELLERRERIKDIAELLRYGHQRNFTTAFTKFHGYPPSQHRKKAAGGACHSVRADKITPSPPQTGESDATLAQRMGEGLGVRFPREVSSPDSNSKSEIGNRKSEIGNRKSEIGNRKSEIGNHSLSQIRV